MISLADRALRMIIACAALSPLWLLTVAALVWGRVALSREEVKRALAWTLGVSVLLAFPAAWGIFTYCAGFNPQPTTSPLEIGGLFAALLLPVYSALVACAAFEFAAQAAQKRGALRRSLLVRSVAGLFIAAVVILGLAALLTACVLSAGPKALG
jgi:hypothetical protein